MNPLADAAALVQGAHEALLVWTRDALDAAGLSDLPVVAGADPDRESPCLAVVPTQVGPWPKTVETAPNINLLGLGADETGAVPEHWRRFGRALTQGVERCWPMIETGGRSRFHPNPPLDALPAPLAAWYRARPEDGGWVLRADGRVCARLPGLSWRPALTLRVNYLFIVLRAGREDVGRGLAALGALSLRLSLSRVLRLRQGPPATDPALGALAEALAASIGASPTDDLVSQLALLRGQVDHLLGLLPGASPSGEDLYELMRSLRLPLQPALPVALHLPLGAGPELNPGTAPSVATHRELPGGPPR